MKQLGEKEYYNKKRIELAEEAKTFILVTSDIITECNDDRLLGMRIRGMLINKIRDCDQTINNIKSEEK